MIKYSILIVDDDETDRYLLKREIKKTGVEAKIFEAENGRGALNFLSQYEENKTLHGDDFPPMVIFLDINMPTLDGFQFLDSFSMLAEESNRYSSCIVVMFSSSERPEDRERALGKRFVKDFITKGQIDTDELRQKLFAFSA